MNRLIWGAWIGAFLLWETIAIKDGNDYTWSLTTTILTYCPAWACFPAITILSVWLIWHFGSYYYEYYKRMGWNFWKK
jgi:hypothetical protein